MKELWTMFWAFFRIGGLTFGGGYAMLPMLQKEAVEKYEWCTGEELMDFYTVGQCVPGIIATNTATFIGFNKRGVLGAIACISGVIAPSIIIIISIASFISSFSTNPIMAHAFAGIRVAVTVLVGHAVYKMGKKALIDQYTVAIFIVALLASLFTSLSTTTIIFIAGIVGIIIRRVQGGKA